MRVGCTSSFVRCLILLCLLVVVLGACSKGPVERPAESGAEQNNTTVEQTEKTVDQNAEAKPVIDADAKPVVEAVNPASKAKVSFDKERIDLGALDEGVEVPCKFSITNVGTEILQIRKVYASCGCTTPTMRKNSLKPKEFAQLDVVIDTSMKQGNITKTVDVFTNDPKRPIVSLAISMMVKDRHKGLSENQKAKILTDEKCMTCHVAQGVGTFGKELYEADCAMCHGQNAEGAIGPCLTFGDFDNASYKKHIRDVIAHGSKFHRSMPGFEISSGGPLSVEQVDSLVTFLGKLTKAKK